EIDIFILDGSILTEPLNLILLQNDALIEKYLSLILEYKKLYSLCNKKNILLVGVIKDTRSSTFRKVLMRKLPHLIKKFAEIRGITSINYRKLMNYFSDLDLFLQMLDVGERSCSFSINSPRNSWIPRQLDLLKNELQTKNDFLGDYKFFAYYLRPVKFDLPLRVEFCMKNNEISPDTIQSLIQTKVNKISSIIMPLSSKLDTFGLPIPQIEAHMRAKLSEEDLKIIVRLLERNISKEIADYSKGLFFNNTNPLTNLNIDEFLLKNRFMVSKRRDRLPL
ncbi:MAG: DNA double-strand break repair nuclease NurA, partial [Promethearchaeota archaeon]